MDPSPDETDGIFVQNSFLREQRVLLTCADFSNLFVDFYIHLQEHALGGNAAMVDHFKDFLAAFTLHAASHPRNEVLAWTIHLQEPPRSFFLTADTELSTVTGRFFTEGVRDNDTNVFYQDIVIRGKEPHRSIVPFRGEDPMATVSWYYAKSEQRPGKCFHLSGDRYALFSAHPDWDENWFAQLDRDLAIATVDAGIAHPIESRQFRWRCGCSHRKILQLLDQPLRADLDSIFGEDSFIQVKCPRCGARYTVQRCELS